MPTLALLPTLCIMGKLEWWSKSIAIFRLIAVDIEEMLIDDLFHEMLIDDPFHRMLIDDPFHKEMLIDDPFHKEMLIDNPFHKEMLIDDPFHEMFSDSSVCVCVISFMDSQGCVRSRYKKLTTV